MCMYMCGSIFILFLLFLFIHNHVALANEMVMWAIASHGGNRLRARGENERGTEKQEKLGQGWISTSMLHSAVAVWMYCNIGRILDVVGGETNGGKQGREEMFA